MANQRKKGVERVTLTIPDELLAQLEAEAEARGIDRLALMREALRGYLTEGRSPTSKKRGAKGKG
jgi:metal-responsive CopG/Arc/MetJ family transcriptional regulator